MSDEEYWRQFVAMAVAKGTDKAKVEAAVAEFRSAQRALSDELAKRR